MIFNESMQHRKEKILSFIRSSMYVPMRASELAMVLQVPPEDTKLFLEIIYQLEKEGCIFKSSKNKYLAPGKDVIKGIFSANPKGFGFVTPITVTNDTDKSNDIFISSDNVKMALHKDTVLCKVTKKHSEDELACGEIVSVLNRHYTDIVGTINKFKRYCYVTADNRKLFKPIYIKPDKTKGAVNNDKVNVSIKNSSYFDNTLTGRVTKVLGSITDPGIDILSIMYQFELPVKFPEGVVKEASLIQDELTECDYKNRVDFRDMLTITIDNDDAKDLDDAVSLVKHEDGTFVLTVHIADVAHYVPENSKLDLEAKNRGNSTYLVDRVIPMLPSKLSNGICSLNCNVDRLALSCIMEINGQGYITSHKIVNSVINVDERLSYTKATDLLENKSSNDSFIFNMLRNMHELALILNNKRSNRGAIEFDRKDCKIILDDLGNVVDIVPSVRNAASSIIEEFMLLCNETIACHFYQLKIPFVFRNNDMPGIDELSGLADTVKNFGFVLNDAKNPKSIQKLLRDVKGSPKEHIILQLVLRSMKQARYEPECRGHFGLAASQYCHFTSPIRRYPDLVIHRIIKSHLESSDMFFSDTSNISILSDICKHCSLRERISDEAETETHRLKKVQFMSTKISDIFLGVISSITSWGIYITLANTVLGLASYNNMTDFFIFDVAKVSCIGETTGKIYRLGDFVKVKVIGVNEMYRTIDFEIID